MKLNDEKFPTKAYKSVPRTCKSRKISKVQFMSYESARKASYSGSNVPKSPEAVEKFA